MANNRRRLVGRVVSDKMEKTVVVELQRRKMHRVYKKVVASTKKVLAHDESNAIPVGTVVRIVESKPLSRRKRWVVESIVTSLEDLDEQEELVEGDAAADEEGEE